MSTKWEKLLESNGVERMPDSVRREAKALNTLKARLERIDKELNSSNLSDKDRAELQGDRNDVAEAVEAQDEVVLETVEKYLQKKDFYIAQSEKMRKLQAEKKAKKAAESTASADQAPADPVNDDPPPAPAGVVVETPKVESVKAEVIEEKPEKKGMSTGTKVVLGGLFLLLTFGAYNYFSKDE